MKPAPFGYAAPETVDQVLGVLDEHGDEAKILAGGQSLLPLMALRLAVPEVLVDVGRVAGLGASEEDSGGCRYAAGVVHSAVEDGRTPDLTGGLMPAVAAGIGYRAIRNRGTLGGSLAHADPSAEWPVVMAALGATFTARSLSGGTREIPARSFAEGFFMNALGDTEFLTSVYVPRPPPGTRWGYHKTCRKPGEFSDSLAVALVSFEGGRVSRADIWLGAAADVPTSVTAVTDALRGRALAEVAKDEVLDGVAASLVPARSADERYAVRRHGITVWRALGQIQGGTT
ncbi:MAG: FAD binding domain-containing protein [Streptosporangiaceae bacterium]